AGLHVCRRPARCRQPLECERQSHRPADETLLPRHVEAWTAAGCGAPRGPDRHAPQLRLAVPLLLGRVRAPGRMALISPTSNKSVVSVSIAGGKDPNRRKGEAMDKAGSSSEKKPLV